MSKKAAAKPSHVCANGLVYYDGKAHNGKKAGADAVAIKDAAHHSSQAAFHGGMEQAHIWAHGHATGAYN